MSRDTAIKQAKAKAARVLRAGGSEAAAAHAAGRCKRQIQRWKLDPAFAALVRHETLITLGHVPEPNGFTPSTDLLGGRPPSKAWVSVEDVSIIGAGLHPLADASVTNNRDPDSGKPTRFTAEVAASVVQVELLRTPERIAAIEEALAAGHAPDDDPGAVIVPLTYAGLLHVQRNPDDLDLLIRAATDFRAWLNAWRFLDQDTGTVRTLGASLWPAQEQYAQTAVTHSWVYFLKARQLGETTIACAFDGWVLRMRDPNARVHMFSRRDDEARELLKAVKFGLENLPDWLQLPVLRQTANEYVLAAGTNDRRLGRAYPTGKGTSRGATCTHAHVDEWAVMDDPRAVWAAVEPTISKTGGTCHILTTGAGPLGYPADTWRKCVAGRGLHHACFIPAPDSRPEYTKEWLAHKRANMGDEATFLHEYPERWEDALAGGGDTIFKSHHLDKAGEYARGFMPPVFIRDKTGGLVRTEKHGYYRDRFGKTRLRKMVTAWDIAGPGENSDAAVGVVLDVTEGVWDVVALVYLQGEEYPTLQFHIKQLHLAYPGKTWIEDNEAGAAVRANLDYDKNMPKDQVEGWKTTRQSKPVMIEGLKLALQNQTLKWKAEECPVLDQEMRTYRWADDKIKQDTVTALAIAVQVGPQARVSGGRVGPIIYF